MTSYRALLTLSFILLAFAASSCDAIGTIFKAGAWTGVIGVVLVILLVWFLLNRIRRR